MLDSLRQQIPNSITLLRIIGIIGILWFTPITNQYQQLLLIITYTIVCTTDFIDGYVARRFNWVSYSGKILDPLADKLLILVFLPLLQMGVITSFPVFIILSREFSIMALRIVAARHKLNLVEAATLGKLKTAISLPVCGLLLARVPTPIDPNFQLPWLLRPLGMLQRFVSQWPDIIFNSLIALVVFITLLSFGDYFCKFIWHRLYQYYHHDATKTNQALRAWVPNAITAANISCGCVAVYFSVMYQFNLVMIAVLTATVCDACDGLLARKLNVSSELGKKLDSQADVISFGWAPAIAIFCFFLSHDSLITGSIITSVYIISVYYRLRRFNQAGHSDYFTGLPSPVGAGFVVVAQQLINTPVNSLIVTLCISALMISRVPYLHFGKAYYTPLRYVGAGLFLSFAMATIDALTPVIIPYTTPLLIIFMTLYIISPVILRPKNAYTIVK